MSRRSLRAATILLLSVWHTGALAQTPAPAPEPAPASTPTATQASTPTPGAEPTTPPKPKPRGNGALFGASDTATAARPLAIDATLSVSSAYDDDLSEGQSATLTPVGGEYSDVAGGLSLSRNGQHSHLSARAATSLRHYPSLHRFVGSTYSAGSDFSLDISSKTTMRASVDGTYVSEFAFDTVSRQSGLASVALSPTGLDVSALDRARLSYGRAAGGIRGNSVPFSMCHSVRRWCRCHPPSRRATNRRFQPPRLRSARRGSTWPAPPLSATT